MERGSLFLILIDVTIFLYENLSDIFLRRYWKPLANECQAFPLYMEKICDQYLFQLDNGKEHELMIVKLHEWWSDCLVNMRALIQYKDVILWV